MSESTIPRKRTPPALAAPRRGFLLREGNERNSPSTRSASGAVFRGRGVRSASASRFWPSALLGLFAAAFGFGLARTLFEWQPQRLAWLGQWPGTLLLVAVLSFLAISLTWQRPGVSPWHAFPLALPALHALAPNVDLLRGWVLLIGGLVLTALLA